jgi:hypothetical protein
MHGWACVQAAGDISFGVGGPGGAPQQSTQKESTKKPADPCAGLDSMKPSCWNPEVREAACKISGHTACGLLWGPPSLAPFPVLNDRVKRHWDACDADVDASCNFKKKK